MDCRSGVSIKKYFKKQQILDEIIVNLVNNETLEEKEEEVMEYVSKEEVSETVKIKQMELELRREIEEKLISERELQREIEETKMIIEREKQEKEIQIRKKEIQLPKEIKERAL